MSSRASTSAGRKRASQRTGRAAGAKASSPRSPAKSKPRSKTAARPKPATRRKPAAKARKPAAKKRKPASRRAGVRSASAKARRPRWLASRGRSARSGRLSRVLRPRNLVIAGVLLLVLAAGYRFWLRDSSLVAVTDVQVVGARGPESAEVERALERSGAGMSTLHVDGGALREAVSSFPTVAGLHVDGQFPHGLTVTVDSRPPVLMADSGSKAVPLAGDGTLLRGVDVGSEKLPRVRVDELPAGKTVKGEVLSEAIIAGAAQGPLGKLIDKVRTKGDQGVVVTLRGLPVIFGTSERAAEKWTAVAATLSDSSLDSLSYLDVRVPDRPAAGGAGSSVEEAPDPSTTSSTDIVPSTTDPATSDPASTTAEPPAEAASAEPEAAPSEAAPETQDPAPAAAQTEASTPSSDASTRSENEAGGVAPSGGGVAP